MEQTPEVGRRRTFYDEAPDYRHPLLEIPADRKARMRERLSCLYGDTAAGEWLPELERIIKVHFAHKSPEMIEKEKAYDPRERFSNDHLILITYGDSVRGDGPTPLASLRRFIDTFTRGAINTLHILPFFPYSSDRGFAVIDFRRVDDKLGSWADIRKTKQRYDLMFDAVLNHCSSRSRMFREFLNGNPVYRDFFIAYDSPDDLTPEQRGLIFRPRTSDILTRFMTIDGPKYLWTTFSADQIDMNFRNPAVLMAVIDSILFYVRRGADLLRLDAVTYLWSEPGTESAHLPQTHEIIKLLRDVVDVAASGVALVTETNVPHRENVAYFGDGRDEAHLVYNFALPPLVLLAFYRGDATPLSQWAQGLEPPSDRTAFLNILDTHDGIGLMGVRGILPEEEIGFIVETAREMGALVSGRNNREATEEPYELNTTWWSALNRSDAGESLDFQVRRFLASRSIALTLKGVPGIYIHGALGTPSDLDAAEAAGEKRDVNRAIVDTRTLMADLWDPGSKLSLLLRYGTHPIQVRRRERAFHPRGAQRVLLLSPRVFALWRTSPEGEESVLAITNVTATTAAVEIPVASLGMAGRAWKSLLSGREWLPEGDTWTLALKPYGVVWLKPVEPSP
ncbi:MAG TPA: sugar phosphorylase [Syntrophales bacterium]|nr:sugar phosphorylase [Syntrophales bacterium]HOS76520.1 sugar phosphorylase [Syntrophales bacterium]